MPEYGATLEPLPRTYERTGAFLRVCSLTRWRVTNRLQIADEKGQDKKIEIRRNRDRDDIHQREGIIDDIEGEEEADP